MKKLKITINNMKNSAFGETDAEKREEVARILHRIAERIENGEEPRKALDANGNSVGEVEIK